jgi:hypothetical protein
MDRRPREDETRSDMITTLLFDPMNRQRAEPDKGLDVAVRRRLLKKSLLLLWLLV